MVQRSVPSQLCCVSRNAALLPSTMSPLLPCEQVWEPCWWKCFLLPNPNAAERVCVPTCSLCTSEISENFFFSPSKTKALHTVQRHRMDGGAMDQSYGKCCEMIYEKARKQHGLIHMAKAQESALVCYHSWVSQSGGSIHASPLPQSVLRAAAEGGQGVVSAEMGLPWNWCVPYSVSAMLYFALYKMRRWGGKKTL